MAWKSLRVPFTQCWLRNWMDSPRARSCRLTSGSEDGGRGALREVTAVGTAPPRVHAGSPRASAPVVSLAVCGARHVPLPRSAFRAVLASGTAQSSAGDNTQDTTRVRRCSNWLARPTVG